MAYKILSKEMFEMRKNPPPKCTAKPIKEKGDIFSWGGTIDGRIGTPYAGRMFRFKIQFPADYPMRPPIIKFLTKVYHPNIAFDGSIDLTTLWSPSLTINKVLLKISTLLANPNPDDPLQLDIAKEFRENRELFKKNAKKWAETYAELPKVKIITAPKKQRIF